MVGTAVGRVLGCLMNRVYTSWHCLFAEVGVSVEPSCVRPTDTYANHYSIATEHVQIHVRCTPYQMEDWRRPWIRQEAQMFVDGLAQKGVDVDYKLLFADEPASIEKHFAVICHIT